MLEACDAQRAPHAFGAPEDDTGDDWGSEGEPECDPGPCYLQHRLPGPGHTFALGDFDGDGSEDVALGDGPGPEGSLHATRILFGDAEGSFRSDQTLVFALPCGHARQLVRVPLGPTDALAWTRGCGEDPMVVELWTDGPGFAQLATVDGWFAGLLVGRFDDDDESDLAVAGRFDGATAPLSILLGEGSGHFAAHAWTGVEIAHPRASASADLDADRLDDIVIVDDGATVHVLLADGTGGFVPGPAAFALEEQPLRIALGEVSGDAIVDLIVLGESGAWIRAGAGDGRFGKGQALLDDDTTVATLSVGDFDGDGLGDVLVGSAGERSRVFTLEHGELEFELDVLTPPVVVAATELGGDGVPDVVYADGEHTHLLLSF